MHNTTKYEGISVQVFQIICKFKKGKQFEFLIKIQPKNIKCIIQSLWLKNIE